MVRTCSRASHLSNMIMTPVASHPDNPNDPGEPDQCLEQRQRVGRHVGGVREHDDGPARLGGRGASHETRLATCDIDAWQVRRRRLAGETGSHPVHVLELADLIALHGHCRAGSGGWQSCPAAVRVG